LTFQNVARATGRRIAILPRDAYVAQQVADAGQETIKLEDPDLALYIKRNRSGIYDARDMVKDWARTTILKFAVPNPNALDHSDSMRELGSALRGAFPRIVRAQEVNAKQSKYLLCLGYWDIQELCDLQPSPGSLYIHSSAEPFNEEMSWSQERLARWLSLNRMDSVHIHASGHARPEDLFQIVERLSPRRVYPIHTEHPEQYVEHFGDIVSLIANGQEVPL
jgi:mRNA degradation ribonuclease J1/J2